MRKFKKLVALGLVLAMVGGLGVSAFEIEDIKDINPYAYNDTGEQITIRITDEDDIKEYCKQTGQEYDPNLVEIFITIDKSKLNYENNVPDELFIGREYYIKNKRVWERTDLGYTLREYGRPDSLGSGRSYSPSWYDTPFIVPLIGCLFLLIIAVIIIFKSNKH